MLKKVQSEIVVRISFWDILLFIALFHITFWPIFFRLVNFQ